MEKAMTNVNLRKLCIFLLHLYYHNFNVVVIVIIIEYYT